MGNFYSIEALRLMVMQKNKERDTARGAILLTNYYARKLGGAIKKSFVDFFKK
jgi:hypothetical protein